MAVKSAGLRDPHARRVDGNLTRDDAIREAMALRVSPSRLAKNEPVGMSAKRLTNDQSNFNQAPSPAPDPKTFRKNKVSGLSFGSLSQSPRTKKDKVRTEPLEKSPNKVRDEKGPTCKARPKNNKGSGGSRDFIPWCDKKR